MATANDKVLEKVIRAPGGLSRILSSINVAAQSSGGDSSKQSTPGKDVVASAAKQTTEPAVDTIQVAAVKGEAKKGTAKVKITIKRPASINFAVKCKELSGEFFMNEKGESSIRMPEGETLTKAAFMKRAGYRGTKWKDFIIEQKFRDEAADEQEKETEYSVRIGDLVEALCPST